MDDAPRAGIIKTAFVVGLLVLMGAGCGKSPVATPVATSTNVAQAPLVDHIENYLQPAVGTERCYAIWPGFLEEINSKKANGIPIVWGGDFSFISDSFIPSFEAIVRASSSSTDVGWTGVLCIDPDQKIVYFTVSADVKKAKIFLPKGEPVGSIGSGEIIGFWKRDGIENISDKILVSDVISLHGFQEIPVFSAITLVKTDRGFEVLQHIEGATGMGKVIDGWPESTGIWKADVVFSPGTNKLELTNYQPPTVSKN